MNATPWIPTPVCFLGWGGVGFYLGRLQTTWAFALAILLAGLMLLIHGGLGREPSPVQARTYPLRALTLSDCAWVLGFTALLVTVTIISTITRAAMGTTVSPAEYERSLQESLGLRVIFAPVACELFFRGWLLARIRRPDGSNTWLAMLVSALLFALVAGGLSLSGPLGTSAAASALGLTAAVLLVKTGSIWAPLLLHVLHNGALMLVAWSAQQRLPPILSGERPVTLATAILAEAVAVLAWAAALHSRWKRSSSPGLGVGGRAEASTITL
jgi:membrane protease YdiL (CAAX protease family)